MLELREEEIEEICVDNKSKDKEGLTRYNGKCELQICKNTKT